MLKSASFVICVCATSKCVNRGNLGRRAVKTEGSSDEHSCNESRVIVNVGGKVGMEIACRNPSENDADEQAQKSTAWSRGISAITL